MAKNGEGRLVEKQNELQKSANLGHRTPHIRRQRTTLSVIRSKKLARDGFGSTGIRFKHRNVLNPTLRNSTVAKSTKGQKMHMHEGRGGCFGASTAQRILFYSTRKPTEKQ